MAYQCINYLERMGDNAEKVFNGATFSGLESTGSAQRSILKKRY